MAKLFAEIDSDKHGHKASKAGDSFLRIELNLKNKTLGWLEIRENTDQVVCLEWFSVGGYSLSPSDRRILAIETKGK